MTSRRRLLAGALAAAGLAMARKALPPGPDLKLLVGDVAKTWTVTGVDHVTGWIAVTYVTSIRCVLVALDETSP